MKAFRPTILGMMTLVALASVALASTRLTSQSLASVLFSVALGLAPLAVVVAIARPGRSRSICSSFAVCDLAYFASLQVGWCRPHFVGYLLTDYMMELAYRGQPGPSIQQMSLMTTVHSVAALASGSAGALIAAFLDRRPSDPDRTTP